MVVREFYNLLSREDGQKVLVYRRGEEKDIVESMGDEVSGFIFNESYRAYVIYLK